jgi:hypothetical protein
MKDMAFASTTPGRIAVPHGFRFTFKDWVCECTSYPTCFRGGALAYRGPQGSRGRLFLWLTGTLMHLASTIRQKSSQS